MSTMPIGRKTDVGTMTAVMGASAYGVLVQDRETGKGYAMHPQCLETLRGMLTDAGCSAWRMIEMGPATTDPALRVRRRLRNLPQRWQVGLARARRASKFRPSGHAVMSALVGLACLYLLALLALV